MAKNPFRFISPDTRLRFIQYATDRERERARRLDAFRVPGDPTFEVGQRIPRDIFRPPEAFQQGSGLVGPAPSRPPLTPGFETGPPVSLGTTIEAVDLPRQLVKEHVIEPIVPEFEVTIPKEIARAGVAGFPVAREVQAVAGIAGQELPDVKITDEVVEEMASWVLDPLNVLPIIGWGPDILRAARAAKKAGPAAVRAFIKGLAKSGDEDALRALKSAVDTSAEAPIARLPGEELGDVSQAGPEGPLQSGVAKLKNALRTQTQKRAPMEAKRHMERVKRVASERELLDKLIAEGVPLEEAIPRARAAFKGKMASFKGPEFGLTDEESQAFWQVLADHPLSYERQRGYDALTKLTAQEPLQPSEMALLRRLYGDDFADVAADVGAGKRLMAKELGEDFPKRLPVSKFREATPEELGFAAAKKVKPKDVKVPKGAAARAWSEFVDIWKFPQAFMQSFDISGAGRQGAKLATRHPKEWWTGTRNYIKAIRSEADAIAFDAAMIGDNTKISVITPDGFQEMKYGEVAKEIMDIHRPLPGTKAAAEAAPIAREEMFISQKMARAWGIKHSEQGFVTGLNQMRHDVGKKLLLHEMKIGRPLTPERVKKFGDLLNRLTGRGNLTDTWFGSVVRGLGWAPGYRVSGPQFALQLFNSDPVIRWNAFQNLATWYGGGSAILALAHFSGAADSVGIDPLSSDFGKIRIGKARYNIWGTDAVLARFAAQAATGTSRNPLTGEFDVDLEDVILRYLRSGADPIVGTVIDVGSGKTYIGEEMKWTPEVFWRELKQRIPLVAQDIQDTYEQEGPLQAIASVPFALFGAGISAYETPSERLATAYNREVERGTFGPDALLYKDENSTVRNFNIQKADALMELDEAREFDERIESNEFREEREQNWNLPSLASRYTAGEKLVGEQLMRNYREYRHDVRIGIERTLFGEEREPETEAEKLVHAWAEINPNDPKYADPVTAEVNWDAVEEDTDAAFATIEKHNPRLAEAIKNKLSARDGALRTVEPKLKAALQQRDDTLDLPRWIPRIKNQDEIEQIHRLVARKNRELADQGLTDVPSIKMYGLIRQETTFSGELIRRAYNLRPGSKGSKKYLNPRRAEMLEDFADPLKDFFPDLYSEEIRAKLAGLGTTGRGVPLSAFR